MPVTLSPTEVTDLSYHIPVAADTTKAHICSSGLPITALTDPLPDVIIGWANKAAHV